MTKVWFLLNLNTRLGYDAICSANQPETNIVHCNDVTIAIQTKIALAKRDCNRQLTRNDDIKIKPINGVDE